MNNSVNRQTLIGCGILKKEIMWLIKVHNWEVDTVFFDSSLHIDFEKLQRNLTSKLSKYSSRDVVVFYGACHPLMDNILHHENTIRTEGQNCVDILLGTELFTEEVSNGAFFLLEDWALRWNYISAKTFGANREVIRQIFQGDRKYVLAIKTPCSGNFTKEAEIAAQRVGLPLKWMEVGLDKLESVLITSLKQEGGKSNE